MQKVTKDLFIKLKELRPTVDSISNDYGTDWKAGMIVERFYLHIPNKYIPFNTEKELQDEIRNLIASTETELGFRFPRTAKELKL